MIQKLVAELIFSPALREKWPSAAITAEAHLNAAEGTEGGPWSMRAELWQPPDAQGRAIAWIYFLSPEAPVLKAELNREFELTLGRTRVATCRVSVMAPPANAKILENDFIEAPHLGLRPAA
jgi:hypothetical protein